VIVLRFWAGFGIKESIINSLNTLILTAVVLTVALWALPAGAEDYIWDGGGGHNNNWDTTANWNASGYPGSGDAAIFNQSVSTPLVSLHGDRTIAVAVFDSTTGYTLSNSTLSLEWGDLFVFSGGHIINSNVLLQVNNTWQVDSGAQLTVNGAVSQSGTRSLTKTGAGTLYLKGANTYSGLTSINAGTLSVSGSNERLSNTGAIFVDTSGVFAVDNITETIGNLYGTGTVALAPSSVLKTGASNVDATFGGAIIGDGRLVKVGTGMVTLTSASTFTGGITIKSGTLTVSSAGQLGSGGVTMDGGLLGIAGTGLSSISDTITMTSNGGGFDIRNSNINFSVNTVINHAGALTKAGPGTLSLSGANTYSGGTIINGGFLRVLSDSNLGATTGSVTLNNATLTHHDDAPVINLHTDRDIVLGGDWGALDGGASSDGFCVLGQVTGDGELRISNGLGGVILKNSANDHKGNTVIGDAATGYGPATTAMLWLGASNVIPDAGLLVFNGGTGVTGTLDMNGFSETVKGLRVDSGSAVIANGSATDSTLTIGAGNATSSFSGVIQDDMDLTKTGTGSLTLSGANTFTGDTNINAGKLVVANANALQNTTVSINVNDGLDITTNAVDAVLGSLTGSGNLNIGSQLLTVGGNNASTTYSGVIRGSGGLSKTGSGALTLTGANTYTDGTTINGGTLILGNNAAAGTGDIMVLGSTIGYADGITVANPIQLQNNVALNVSTGSATQAGAISERFGSWGIAKTGSGTLALTGANTYTGGTTISAGSLQIGSGGTTGSILGNVTSNASLIFNRSDDVTFSGTIGGTGSVTKDGSGALTLTASNNSYSGGTIVNGGHVRVNEDSCLGLRSGDVTLNNATLMNNDSAVTLHADRDIVLGGDWGAIRAGWRFRDITVNSRITGSGELRISNDTSAVVLTNQTNNYTGDTVIGDSASGGAAARAELRLGAHNVIPEAGALVFRGGSGVTGYLDMNGFNETIGGLRTDSGSADIVNFSPTVSTLTVGSGDAAGSFGGRIRSNISLVKIGSGTLTLTGASDYTQGTTVSGGALQIGNGGATGLIGGGVTNNASLIFNRSDDLTFAGAIDGTGSVTKDGAGTLTLTGANTYTGGTIIAEGTLLVTDSSNIGPNNTPLTFTGGALRAENTSSITLAHPLVTDGADAVIIVDGSAVRLAKKITGDGGLVKGGTGELVLEAPGSSYSGSTTINDGRLQVQGDEMLPDDTNLIVNAGRFVQWWGYTETVGSLSGSGDVGFGGVDNHLIVGNNNSSTTFSGTIEGSGGKLTKIGSGTLTLTGVNTHGRGTTVSSGALQIGDGGTTGSIAGDITNNASLIFNRSNDQAFAGAISGTGGVTKLGSNKLTLTGANTYAGGTILENGTLSLGSGSAAGSGAITIPRDWVVWGAPSPNSTIDYADGITVANAIALQRDVTLNVSSGLAAQSGVISETLGTWGIAKSGAGTLALTGANSYSGGTTVNGGFLRVNSDSNLGATAGAVTLNGGVLMNNGATVNLHADRDIVLGGSWGALRAGWSGKDIIVNGRITGDGELRISNDSSMVRLANPANDYTGNTVIGDDATGYGSAPVALLGLGASDVIPDAGLVVFNGGSGVTGMLHMNGFDETIRGLRVDSGNATIANFLSSTDATLTVGAGDTTSNFGGLIRDNISLVKTGSGTLTLTGKNTYSEGTTIKNGTLALGGNSAVGTGTITVAPTITLSEDFSSGPGVFMLNAPAVVDSGSVRLTEAIGGQQASAISQQITNGPIPAFDAAFDFKIGGGTGGGADGMSFTLLDAGSYGNNVVFGEDGPGANSLTISFDVYDNGAPEPGGNFVEVLFNGSSVATAVPSFALENNQWNNAQVSFSDSAVTLTLTPQGGSPEVLFSDLAVPGFTPDISRIGFGARTGGSTNEHRFDNLSFTAPDLSIWPTIDYADTVTIANAIDLRSNVRLRVLSGSVTQSGAIGDTGGSYDVMKIGMGTLTLTGANSYTGGTTIAGGTLLAGNTAGSATGVGPVQVNLGGTLSGGGSVAGAVTVASGGALAPGASAGTLTLGDDLTLQTGSTLKIELGGLLAGDWDVLDVAGAVEFGGTLQVSLIDDFVPQSGDTFDILDWGSLAATTFDAIELPELSGRIAWNTSGLYTDGVIEVIGMLDGDTDVDWDVDTDDYNNFVAVFGTEGDWHTDFNEDGRVDLTDFVLIRANFGIVVDLGPAPIATPTVTPEPATLTLLALGGLAILRRRIRVG